MVHRQQTRGERALARVPSYPSSVGSDNECDGIEVVEISSDEDTMQFLVHL